MLEKKLLMTALSNAFDIPVMVTYWDGKTDSYGDGEPKVHIRLNNKISMSDLASAPTLFLAEAYMNEDIEFEGNLQELVASAYRKADSFLTNQSGFTAELLKSMMKSHSQKESRDDIRSHYDIGNDFYKKWLDPTMTYSCAYFEKSDMTLEEAQIAKNRHILDKLNCEKGKKILDIGCGWGTLAIMAAQKYGLIATGVTLSDEQCAFASNRVKELGLQDRVQILLMDYRDIKENFDYIVSVGMFEHVGKENLALYFQKVYEYLKPTGRALIHGITGQGKGAGVDPFIAEYIFPGGYIPRISEIVTHITNSNLQIYDIETRRRHYQKTLECWRANYLTVFDETVTEMGKPFARMWDLYLQACAASFEAGNLDVIQYLMTKGSSGQGLPLTRSYMYTHPQ